MKRLTLIIAAVLSTGLLYAQTDQGALFVGGSGSYTRNNTKSYVAGQISFEDIQVDISLVPSVGYFLADGILVGAAVEYDHSRQFPKGQPDSDFKNGSFLVGPFARYYHSSDYFVEVILGFGNTGSEGFKNSLFNWSAGAGKAIFFNEFVAIEPQIVWQSSTITPDSGADDRTVSSGPAVKIGFAIFIQ